MNFADQVIRAIDTTGSIAVVGLDPRADMLPESVIDSFPDATKTAESASAAFLEFNRELIDLLAGKVAAVKPQVAFYERFGWQGYNAYQETLKYARSKGVLTIGDIKRGDIASTAEAYAEGHLSGQYAADSVTLNPYMGIDALEPFFPYFREQGRGMFALVKTSNPSSVDVQDLDSGGEPIYTKVATQVAKWGEEFIGECGYSSVGAVVGATWPEQLATLRGILKHNLILIPGYGAQGGGAGDVKPGLDANGSGALVNSSRGIIASFCDTLQDGDDWRDHVMAAVDAMNKDLNAVR